MRACAIAVAAAAVAVTAAGLSAGCGGGGSPGPDGGSPCSPACSAGTVCRYDACVSPPAACARNLDCGGDHYCDASAGECLPWGVGPGGDGDPACKRAPVPGVYHQKA